MLMVKCTDKPKMGYFSRYPRFSMYKGMMIYQPYNGIWVIYVEDRQVFDIFGEYISNEAGILQGYKEMMV